MGKKLKYIKETYIDDYKTLTQAILIDVEMDKQSNGMLASVLRAGVNPNLHLVKTEEIYEKEGRIKTNGSISK